MGWEYSQTLHWNSNRKFCSTACAWFLPVPIDDVGGGGNPTAWCRSGTHPWWMYFSLKPVDVGINKALKMLMFAMIGKIGCWTQESMFLWLNLLHNNWLLSNTFWVAHTFLQQSQYVSDVQHTIVTLLPRHLHVGELICILG